MILGRTPIEISIRRYPATVLPDEPLATMLDSLQERARNDDPQAAHVLATALRRCRASPSSRGQLQTLITEAQVEYRVAGISVSDPSAYIEQLRADFEYCQGVPDGVLAKADDFMIQAAEAGHLSAQLDTARVGVDPPKVSTDVEDVEVATRDLLKQQGRRALRYLQRASEAGSVEALLLLGFHYEDGVHIERDPTKAYAYLFAAEKVYSAISHQRGARLREYVETLGNRLSPHEQTLGEKFASALLSSRKCCLLEETSSSPRALNPHIRGDQ